MTIQSFSSNSFFAGLVLGVILASSWFIGKAYIPPVTDDTQESTQEQEESHGSTDEIRDGTLPDTSTQVLSDDTSGSISVADQSAGMVVNIESVTVPPPGVWVAVREVVSGELGNVLGAERVGGPRSHVSVSLLRATEPGRSYAVQLYRDNGDDVFVIADDSVYVDFTTGEAVVAPFSTTR